MSDTDSTSTLVLSRSDVARHLDALHLMASLREAFVTDARGRTVAPQRARATLHADGTAMCIFPGAVEGVPAYTVKVHAKFPGQTPAIRGVLHLHDLATGRLLAIMDSGHLTAVRTGLLGALGVDALARPGATRLALIGAGVQARQHLRSTRHVRSVTQVRVYDPEPARAFAFCRSAYDQLKVNCQEAGSVEEAVADADLVVTATWSRTPFLAPGMLAPGAHVTALGADEPGKAELTAELLTTARLVVDHRGLSVSSGAVGSAGLTEEAVDAELGEVLAGLRPGREGPDQVTVFAPVGLPFHDLVAAWHVYESARHDDQVTRIDLGA